MRNSSVKETRKKEIYFPHVFFFVWLMFRLTTNKKEHTSERLKTEVQSTAETSCTFDIPKKTENVEGNNCII